MLSRTQRLKRARITLLQGGSISGNLLNPQIAQSWERCVSLGLDPMAKPPALQLSAQELTIQREKDDLVYRFARAEMHSLYEQIAGSNFLIAFGNAQGTVLDIIADGEFQTSKAAEAITPGAIWAEDQRGTNALGTCARDMRSVVVHGEEHFFHDHCDVSCFAAPVFHSDGALAGVLDASSDCRARHTHTLALMRMAATHIENALFLAQQNEHIVVLFHSRWELLNSVSGGLVSFDRKGKLVSINQRGREILRGLPVRPGVMFEDIFSMSFDAALREMADNPHPILRDLLGSQYSALWRNRHAFEQQTRQTTSAGTAPASRDRGKPDRYGVIESFDLGAGMVADDPQLCRQLAQVSRAIHLKPPFLILGESGTGKEVVARFIHKSSGRKGAFVAVNCGAIPENLFEAELFGYVGGAFTGAQREGSKGLAVSADGGTLFLDEIGDMSAAGQVALLRFLDSSEVRPVGGSKTRKVDVQIVAATNVDLQAAIGEKAFREDLYYRLGVVRLELPPLRARSDFADIVRQMLDKISPDLSIDPYGVLMLGEMPWRGNIRELHSVMLQLAIGARNGEITAEDVRSVLGRDGEGMRGAAPESLRAKMRQEVAALLRSNGNNISQTAKILGISRNTVYKYARESETADTAARQEHLSER